MTPRYSVEFHPEAIAEARAAAEWYKARSRPVADAFVAEISHAVEQIEDEPDRWPEYILGTRRYLLHRFPFLIVYRQEGQAIQVLAVAHGRRAPGYWKSR